MSRECSKSRPRSVQSTASGKISAGASSRSRRASAVRPRETASSKSRTVAASASSLPLDTAPGRACSSVAKSNSAIEQPSFAMRSSMARFMPAPLSAIYRVARARSCNSAGSRSTRSVPGGRSSSMMDQSPSERASTASSSLDALSEGVLAMAVLNAEIPFDISPDSKVERATVIHSFHDRGLSGAYLGPSTLEFAEVRTEI